MLMMAQDGFVINFHLTRSNARLDKLIDLACGFLWGTGTRARDNAKRDKLGIDPV